jgi:hypothetical protein
MPFARSLSSDIFLVDKLPGPIDPELAALFNKSTVVATATPSTPKTALATAKSTVPTLTLAEIPPFNPVATGKAAPSTLTVASKISATAPAFVFRPSANTFTPVRCSSYTFS